MPGVHFDGGCHPVTLAPGETLTCVTRYHVMQDDMDTGSIVNDASVTGTPSTGPDVTDTASVTVTALDAPPSASPSPPTSRSTRRPAR